MNNDVKVIDHNLSCRCHRREETFEIEGKSFTVQYSAKSADSPPMSDHDKRVIADALKNYKNS